MFFTFEGYLEQPLFSCFRLSQLLGVDEARAGRQQRCCRCLGLHDENAAVEERFRRCLLFCGVYEADYGIFEMGEGGRRILGAKTLRGIRQSAEFLLHFSQILSRLFH